MSNPAQKIKLHQASLNLAFTVTPGAPPEWVMIFAAGEVRLRDGRVFLNDDADAVVARFNNGGTYLPVDFEHESEKNDPLYVSAAGWIEGMEVRAGAIWARIGWTELGADALAKKEFRHISPAFSAEKGTARLYSFSSLALVLKPAMILPAVASLQEQKDHLEMDKTIICAALGVDPAVSDETVLAALQTVTVRAKELETELAALRTETAALKQGSHDIAVTAALDEAQRDSRITPGEREYFKVQCATAEGLEGFKAYAAGRDPVISKGERTHSGDTSERPSLASKMRGRYEKSAG